MIADVEEGLVPAEQMLNLVKYNGGNVKKDDDGWLHLSSVDT